MDFSKSHYEQTRAIIITTISSPEWNDLFFFLYTFPLYAALNNHTIIIL